MAVLREHFSTSHFPEMNDESGRFKSAAIAISASGVPCRNGKLGPPVLHRPKPRSLSNLCHSPGAAAP